MSVGACIFGTSRYLEHRLAVSSGTRNSVRASSFPVPFDSQHRPLLGSLPSRRGGEPFTEVPFIGGTLWRAAAKRRGAVVCSIGNDVRRTLGAFERAATLHSSLCAFGAWLSFVEPHWSRYAALSYRSPGHTPSLSIKGAARRLRRWPTATLDPEPLRACTSAATGRFTSAAYPLGEPRNGDIMARKHAEPTTLLTTAQVAAAFGYARETILLAVRNGELVAHFQLPTKGSSNGAYLFLPSEVARWRPNGRVHGGRPRQRVFG